VRDAGGRKVVARFDGDGVSVAEDRRVAMVKAAVGQREWPFAAPAAWSQPESSAVSGLLDRDEELGRIAAAFAAAVGGRGGLLAVVGAAGIGKTRLLDAATELGTASAGAVVSAGGGQGESEFAFGAVRQLFEPVWAACGRRERDALVAGAAAPVVSLLGKPAVAWGPCLVGIGALQRCTGSTG